VFCIFAKIVAKISVFRFRVNFCKNMRFLRKFSRKSAFFVFAKIFAKILRDFRENENFSRNKISWKSAHFRMIFAFSRKIEKCIFVSTLVTSSRVETTIFVFVVSPKKRSRKFVLTFHNKILTKSYIFGEKFRKTYCVFAKKLQNEGFH
jgi:hypothetical protein